MAKKKKSPAVKGRKRGVSGAPRENLTSRRKSEKKRKRVSGEYSRRSVSKLKQKGSSSYGSKHRTPKAGRKQRKKSNTRETVSKSSRTPAQLAADHRKTAEFKRRSEASKKSWRKRKQKEKKRSIAPQPPQKKNRVYFITLKLKSGKRERKRPLNVVVWSQDGFTDLQVFNHFLQMVRKRRDSEYLWVQNMEVKDLIVAHGPLTDHPQGYRSN
jgi:hypothetical protein